MTEQPTGALHPERLAVALCSRDFPGDLDRLTQLLGNATFVDRGAWAQFDIGGSRLCLADSGEGVDGPVALLLKVGELAAAAEALTVAGFEVTGARTGSHEERIAGTAPSGLQVIAYRPLGEPVAPGAANEPFGDADPVGADVAAPVGADVAALATPHTEVEIDPAHFREVLGHFSTGVVVVTAAHEGAPSGMSAQSVVSLSLDPPLLLFCPAKSSTTWPKIRAAGCFAVNILAADQQELSIAFSRSGTDKFAGVAWDPGRTGSPLLAGALGHVECALEQVHDGGDHEIVIGRVVDLAVRRDAGPLIFYRSGYLAVDEPRAPAPK